MRFEVLTSATRIAERAKKISGAHQHHRKHDGRVRRVSRNVKRWRPGSMTLRWTAAAMLENGFRKLKAYKQLR